ncbi:MAG: MFS transporter [Pyrinomonadaceae bacterium]|nr:MFS transporter [Pyrinomonadaceae bacterium]
MVGLLWIAYFTNYIDRQVVFSIFPSLRQEFGFSSAQLGLVGTVFTWVYSLCMPISGRAADLVNRERMIVVSLVLWSLCTLGTGMSSSLTTFLLWRAAMGVTESMYVPAALSLIGSVLPASSKSRGLAVHMTAQIAGIAAGGWFGGWMADTLGWRTGFAWLAGAGMAYAVILGAAFARLPRLHKSRSNSQASRPLDLFRSRCYIALGVAFFMFCIMLWIQYAWLANHMFERFGLSMSQAGFMSMMYLQAGSAAGVLIGGFLGDHVSQRYPAGRFYVAAAGLILSAPFSYAAFSASSVTGTVSSACCFGLFAGLMMSNIFASAYDVVARQNYGLSAGFLNFAGGLAGGAGILAAGLWKDTLGIALLTAGSAAAGMLCGVLLIIVVRRRFAAEAQSTISGN